jgi:hypothetical protein
LSHRPSFVDDSRHQPPEQRGQKPAVQVGAVFSRRDVAGHVSDASAEIHGHRYWIVAAILYLLAKLLEYFDGQIYSIGYVLSGHTLKHLAAAAACFAILRYFQTRQPVTCAKARETTI